MSRSIDDSCRELEARMSPEQMNLAIAMVRAAGWGVGTRPPAFVWLTAFHDVLRLYAETPTETTHRNEQGASE